MSRINLKPRRQNSRRSRETKRCPQFLQWLRGRPCILASDNECEGKIEAAHVDFMGNKGMGTKTEDWNAIPCCSLHHRRQHALGWHSFQAAYSIDAAQAAKSYWKAWPGRPKWEASR